jgi:hypothetical protein
MKDLLLPSGHQLESGHTVLRKVQSGDGWQIYSTNCHGRLLLINEELAGINFASDVLSDKLFTCCTIGEEIFYLLETEASYELSHVKHSEVPKDFSEAKAFAHAFSNTRKLIPRVDLSDTIYIEKFSRLLIVGKSDRTADVLVLGRWLTGGVGISIDKVDRIKSLSGISSTELLNEIFYESGILKCAPSVKLEGIYEEEFRLIGRHALEKFLIEHIIDVIKNPSVYHKLGIKFPTPFILYGSPGCGKTYAVEKLIEYLNFPSFHITSNTVGSPYIHETSKKISEIFESAIANSPSIVVIDEMESFLSNRSGGIAGQHHVEEVNEFLRLIPRAIESSVLVIGMTNQVEMLDPAVTRRGRFDFCIEVEMPREEEIEELFEHLVSKLPCDLDNKCELYDQLYGRQPSDVAFVVKEAGRIAARLRDESLKTEYFIRAIEKLPKVDIKNRNKIGFI